MRVPLGMYRVAKDAKPSHRWEGIVLRSGIFRNAKHAQRQCVRSNSECRNTKNHRNHLNNNVLRKHTENCVFRPNSSVKEKKCVVFTIDCWHNSRSSNIGHNASTSTQELPTFSLRKMGSSLSMLKHGNAYRRFHGHNAPHATSQHISFRSAHIRRGADR